MSNSLKRVLKLLLVLLLLAQCAPALAARGPKAKAFNDAVLGAIREVRATLKPHMEDGKKTFMEVLQDAGKYILS